MDESTRVLYRVLQERYVKVVWTHKIQLCQASIHAKVNRRHNMILAFLSCAVSTAAITNILKGLPECLMVPILALLSLVLSFFTIMYKSENLAEASSENEHFAATMHDLRNRYEGLLADIKAGQLTNERIIERREVLEREENLIYSGIVPSTSPKAVDEAAKALKINKDSITTDREIEMLISATLQI